MSSSPSQVPVKNEPDADQDDFLMSYLNADCLATDWPALKLDPPSPPYSTSSSTDDFKPQPFTEDINNINNDWFAANNNAAAAAAAAAAMTLPPELFFQPFIPPTAYIAQPPSSPNRSGSSSSSDSEQQQPRKKRGRKKRDSTVSIAPAPLKPLAPAALNVPFPPTNAATTTTSNSTTTATPPPPPSMPPQTQQQPIQQRQQQQRQNSLVDSSEDAQKAAAIAKRQERLIKNRAAALLSRKRKREHLNQLEQERQSLSAENEQLKQRVAMLEAEVDNLQRENQELRTRLNEPAAPAATKHASNRTTSVVFMILLFSFALFSLPARTVDRLTVGGNTASPLSLAGGSPGSVDVSFYRARPTLDSAPVRPSTTTTTTKDLVLIDPVQPHALQNWIEGKLTKQQPPSSQELMQWPPQLPAAASSSSPAAPAPAQIYLYSPEFSQVAPVNGSSHVQEATAARSAVADKINGAGGHPILSLISPFEANSTFLQIDVQVLGSRIIDSQLLQCPHATSLVPDNDLLCRPNSGVVANDTVKDDNKRRIFERSDKWLKKDLRRKIVGQERARKLARVVSS